MNNMIKGVNKNVIEISETNHACFERAILFVRPEKMKEEYVRNRAFDYLSGIKMRPWYYPKNKRVLRVLGWLLAASVGATISALFFLL